VLAIVAGSLWAIRPDSERIDGIAGSTEVDATRLAEARPAPTTVPTTVPTTTTVPSTTTVPELIVGPLEAKGKPVPVVFRIGTFDPVVFITVDDGGIRRPELVEYVRRSGIPITMFLTERYTSGDGVAYFRELQDLGATVQTHSITHTSLRGKPLEFQTDEVCGPVDAYERDYGERPRYFRPPYGNYDTNTLVAARSCGLKAVLWWSATYDSGTLRLQEAPLRRGEIILMHFNDHLTQDLQLLVQEVEAAGLRPALLDDYLDAAPVLP
jgi:peptidoglycan/xylan/chitin deacetylase (PgdA/CDA1 family)